jgi:hypothetical protein
MRRVVIGRVRYRNRLPSHRTVILRGLLLDLCLRMVVMLLLLLMIMKRLQRYRRSRRRITYRRVATLGPRSIDVCGVIRLARVILLLALLVASESQTELALHLAF